MSMWMGWLVTGMIIVSIVGYFNTQIYQIYPSVSKKEYIESKFKNETHIAVIGGGLSGLTAACELRKLGYRVTIYEKNPSTGGRSHQFKDDSGHFTFDAGPSWYWMPEIFDMIFERYGHQTSDFYQIKRLDPAYRMYNEKGKFDVPGTLDDLNQWIKKIDPNSKPEKFFGDIKYIYERSMYEWIWKPMVGIWELFDLELISAGLFQDMFGSYEKHLDKYVSNDLVKTILKWPVIFIGASPKEAPSMYALMSYGGHVQGTWYPDSGMVAPGRALTELAMKMGVEIKLNSPIDEIKFKGNNAKEICSGVKCDSIDGIVSSADYHYVEQNLLPLHLRKYDTSYWSERVLSPSCLLFYLGFDSKIKGLIHHNFFFNGLEEHLNDVFKKQNVSDFPTFYVSATSKTDPSVAPAHGETLFVLIPIPYSMNGTDTKSYRKKMFEHVLNEMESHGTVPTSGKSLKESLIHYKDYGTQEFSRDFHSFRGNAFGLANILSQSLILKPSMDSKVSNMVFVGHLTNPGPGVPPTMVSGIVGANLLKDKLDRNSETYGGSFTSLFLHAIVGLHLLALISWLVSTRVRSYVKCVDLIYCHGRTYFAAATLMNPTRFFDTAAMYALFRVADDFVDREYDGPETRKKNLEKFIQDFWKCWESGVGDYELHPVLPAVIESSVRNNYTRELFQVFFKSMRMDVDVNICQTWNDTYEYMRGSASVIGDFMIPILMNEKSQEERDRAMPHAQDLGNAFQLTNMIRDINEDLDLGRQYMPMELCQKHNVDLNDRNHDDPNFKAFIDDMLDHTDKLYESADIGIKMLPECVRDVITVARTVYHAIHQEIRKANYRIFNGRVKVKFSQKAKIAMTLIPLTKILRMVGVELYFLILHTLIGIIAPVLIPFGFALAFQYMALYFGFSNQSCTYAMFHVLFTIPQTIGLWYIANKRSQERYFKNVIQWTFILCVLATVYTTPWDNYLIYTNSWAYGLDRVAFVIGYCPIEEYSFFSIETLMTIGIWLWFFPNSDAFKKIPKSHSAKSSNILRIIGLLSSIITIVIGFIMIFHGKKTFYLGMICIFGGPIFGIQTFFGARSLIANFKKIFLTITTASIYLCIMDAWAIGNGIWQVNPNVCAVPEIYEYLPFEEALFYFVSASMCVFGLSLGINVLVEKDRKKCSYGKAAKNVFFWSDDDSKEDQLGIFQVLNEIPFLAKSKLD